MTVFLCGFMGCGKTTVGRLAAKKLGYAYIDTDELIVKNECMTIPEIFSLKGEAYFRKIEAETVKSLCGRKAVVACGGGALLNKETAHYAAENGIVVFLDVPFGVCYERIKNDANRPIAAASTETELHERFDCRHGIYMENSNVYLDGSGTPVEIADRIIEALKKQPKTVIAAFKID